jgi:drug/metabolite transporter (DMT)-like permease
VGYFMKERTEKQNVIIAYVYLILVVFLWGIGPLFSKSLLEYFSPSMYSAIGCTISAISLLIICLPHLNKLNVKYFLTALPFGFFVGLASLLQKIGLLHTTPAKYSFLENLSCIAVPVLMFLFIRKKPSFLTILSSVTCLVGAFVLSGLNFKTGISFGIGEILCALAGIIYGFNIAGTGCFAKELKASLYILIHMGVSLVVSVISMLVLNAITINGAPITPIYFSFKTLPVIIALALISNVLCWIMRTNSLKKINTTTVAVIMPFSAVVASVFSIIVGTDVFSLSLLFGGLIIFASILLSSLADARETKLSKIKK